MHRSAVWQTCRPRLNVASAWGDLHLERRFPRIEHIHPAGFPLLVHFQQLANTGFAEIVESRVLEMFQCHCPLEHSSGHRLRLPDPSPDVHMEMMEELPRWSEGVEHARSLRGIVLALR